MTTNTKGLWKRPRTYTFNEETMTQPDIIRYQINTPVPGMNYIIHSERINYF